MSSFQNTQKSQIYEVWEAASICEALPYQHPTDFVAKRCVGCNLYNPLLYTAIDGLSVPVPSKMASDASGSKLASKFGPPAQINSSDGRQRVVDEGIRKTKKIEAEKARKALFENTDDEIEVVGSEMETSTYKKKGKEIVKRSHGAEARILSINNTKKLKPQNVEKSILSLSVSVWCINYYETTSKFGRETIIEYHNKSMVQYGKTLSVHIHNRSKINVNDDGHGWIEYELIIPRFVKYLTGCNVGDNTSLVRLIDDADSIAFAKSINKKTKDAVEVDMKGFWGCINCRDFLFTQDNFKHPKGKNYVEVIILLKFKESSPAQPRKRRFLNNAAVVEDEEEEAESSSSSGSNSETNLILGGTDESDTINDEALAGPSNKRQRFDQEEEAHDCNFDIVNPKEPGNFLGEGGYSPWSHQKPLPKEKSPGLFVTDEEASITVEYPLKTSDQGLDYCSTSSSALSDIESDHEVPSPPQAIQAPAIVPKKVSKQLTYSRKRNLRRSAKQA